MMKFKYDFSRRKISRDEARTQGLNKYYTGEPCKKGHTAERYVANSTCCVCAMNSAYRSKLKQLAEFGDIRRKVDNLRDQLALARSLKEVWE